MESLIKKFFKIYCKFFKADINISLLYGTEYQLIYAFLTLYNECILDIDIDDAKSHQKLDTFSNIVDDYIRNIKTNFTYFDDKNQYFDCICSLDDISFDKLYNFLSETTDIYEEYYKAYQKLSQYEDATMLHNLLIEYNNFLSHILRYFCLDEGNKNLPRSNAHLYRGALDAHKEIINSEKLIVLPNKNLFSSFIDIRDDEISILGQKDINTKINMMKKYDDITNDILSGYNKN